MISPKEQEKSNKEALAAFAVGPESPGMQAGVEDPAAPPGTSPGALKVPLIWQSLLGTQDASEGSPIAW